MQFDRVLADVPCSGFGTLRKNPDLKWRKGEGDIKRLSELQMAILTHLSEYVKKGGVLVYSTCTVFREENEGVVEKFLEGHPEFQLDRTAEILLEKCHTLIKDGYLKTFPPKDQMDGFFVARLIKANSP
jgi:16S rRNA (cytosine967-C5)-methyltransferase